MLVKQGHNEVKKHWAITISILTQYLLFQNCFINMPLLMWTENTLRIVSSFEVKTTHLFKVKCCIPHYRWIKQLGIILALDYWKFPFLSNMNIRPNQLIVSDGPISHILQCIRQISHNALFCNRNMYFCYKMEHCGIWNWCIVEFVRLAN